MAVFVMGARSLSAGRRAWLARIGTAAGLMTALVLAAGSPAHAAADPEHHYVTDSLKVGSSVAEADSYALDLNGDGRTDDALGHVLAGLSSALNIDTSLASSLRSGDTVMLDSLRARSFVEDHSASWQVYVGKPQRSLSGRFTIDPAAPAGSALPGSLLRRQFNGGPGTVPLRLGLVPGSSPAQVDLIGARLQADCTPFACSNGRVGGGIPEPEVDAQIVPALAAAIQAVVNAGCTGATPDTCSGTAANLENLFDTNGDLKITANELRANALLSAVLAPDLDLLGANGRPGHDGVNDSLSVAFGFTAKAAVFNTPRR
jgi:hypothetical protein